MPDKLTDSEIVKEIQGIKESMKRHIDLTNEMGQDLLRIDEEYTGGSKVWLTTDYFKKVVKHFAHSNYLVKCLELILEYINRLQCERNKYRRKVQNQREEINRLQAENETLQNFKSYFDFYYGCDIEILGIEENGDTTTFDEFYNCAIANAESIEHHIAHIIKTAKATRATCSAIHSCVSEAIVARALVVIRQHVIRLSRLLELLLGLLIGVVLDSGLTVGLLYGICIGIALDAQHLIVISLICHSSLYYSPTTTLA